MMKISKIKRQLAQLLIEAGVTQFPNGANWAAQDRNATVTYFNDEPWRCHDCWEASQFEAVECVKMDWKVLPNWHQCILSRSEFDRIVSETAPDADGWIGWGGAPRGPVSKGTPVDVKMQNGTQHFGRLIDDEYWSDCWGGASIIAYRLHKPEQSTVETRLADGVDIVKAAAPALMSDEMKFTGDEVMGERKLTLDQLLQDWRNADDYAKRKQAEADEAAAMRDERWNALQARAGEMGLTVGRCESVAAADEPELVITNWRDLLVGDEIEVVESNLYSHVGRVGVVSRFDKTDDQQPVRVIFYGSECDYDWPTKWRFIRRP